MQLFRKLLLAMMAGLPQVLLAQLTGGEEAKLSSTETASAYSDSIVQLTADMEGLAQVLPESLPRTGTFWWALPGKAIGLVPTPLYPPEGDWPVYSITEDAYLVDLTLGETPAADAKSSHEGKSKSDIADRKKTVLAEAQAVADVIEMVQEYDAEAQFAYRMTVLAAACGLKVPAGGYASDGGNVDENNGQSKVRARGLAATVNTNLWLSQIVVASGWLNAVASNTIADVEYDIQSCTNLAQANWQSEGFIYGSELTNWTALSVAQNGRAILFLRLKSWASSDGSGIPDWWELQYFGTNNINPNAQDGAGDGWTIYQKFQMGVSPNTFYTPAAPQGVTVTLSQNGQTAAINWVPNSGAVASYTVEKSYQYIDFNPAQINDYTTTASSYLDNVSGQSLYSYVWNNYDITYRVKANYSNGGSSAWSPSMVLAPSTVSGIIVPATNGQTYLVVSQVPTNAAYVRLVMDFTDYNYDTGNEISTTINHDIPVYAFTNGSASIPTSWQDGITDIDGGVSFDTYISSVDANGNVSRENFVDGAWGGSFYDARVQMKQNLIFQLRAAPVDTAFHFDIPPDDSGDEGSFGAYVGYYDYPTNYVCAGLFPFVDTYNSGGGYNNIFDPYLPFEENCLFRNFVFNLGALDDGGNINTGVANGLPYAYEIFLKPPLLYQFQTNVTAFPNLLSSSDSRWFFYDMGNLNGNNGKADAVSAGIVNVASDGSNYITLAVTNNACNWFGLPYVSVNVAYADYDAGWNYLGIANSVIEAGHSVTITGNDFYTVNGNNQAIYVETAQPKFKTVKYCFYRPEYDVLPGSYLFAPTNDSPQLILYSGFNNTVNAATNDLPFTVVPAGQIVQLATYAKLEVTNSCYSGVYAYLGQYLDKAYQVDDYGQVTTNTTGVVTPLNYFANQIGAAALVTMPDPDTGERGTGMVYSVTLALDKNHDGIMDLSFNGQDGTSQLNPMIFWCNNNFDRWNYDPDDATNYMDDVASTTAAAGCPLTPKVPTPDCNYSNVLANGYAYRAIPCTRDLEDFARLWVCGVNSNLLAVLPTNSTVTLNWGDLDSPNSSNPTIDIFQAADADGGMGYLTNSAMAAAQTNVFQNRYVGRLGPGQSLQLNAATFANHWAGNHFIWCGVNNGGGGLNLTIQDGSGKLLVQTTAYIQIVDIKQMYERWTVGDNPAIAPLTNALLATDNGFPVGTPAFAYPQNTDTNTHYILFVHGWNMESWEKDRFAETAFKRLYWQGYQGRFGSFRWPTTFHVSFGNSVLDQTLDAAALAGIYDPGEYNAWNSSDGLLNFLKTLQGTYGNNVYVLAHSMGNVVTGEALRKAAQQGLGQLVNTYVASQAAVPGHCYDSTLSGNDLLNFPTGLGPTTANIYNNWLATNSAVTGSRINFYNTNDYALSANIWQLDEVSKPDWVIGINPPYGYSGSPSDNPPLQDGFYSTYKTYIGSLESVLYLGNANSVSNRYEITAFAAEPRSLAMGAINMPALANSVYLGTVWPPDTVHPLTPYDEHFYHSAEFRGDNPQMQGYWSKLLSAEAFNLK